ncbi:MAG: pilus assembly protein PilM [Pseudomonadales bacterium]
MQLKGLISRARRPRRHGAIGVELSLTQFNLVQLRKAGQELAVGGFGSAPTGLPNAELFDRPEIFKRSLKQALAAGRFRGRRVVAAMPSSMVRVMPLTYQVGDGQSTDQAIVALMQERIGEGLADFVLDYLPVENKGSGRQNLALVAMCRRETVTRYLDLLRSCKLEVDCLEIGPIAIRRLVAHLQQQASSDNVLVVNCGREKSYLTLVAGGRLLSDEQVEFGENTAVAHVAAVLKMDEALAMQTIGDANLDPSSWGADPDLSGDAMLAEVLRPSLDGLVREIQRALVFASSESTGGARNEIYLLGSLARWPGCETYLSDLLHVPVRTVPNPFVGFRAAKGSQAKVPGMPELAVATGLALYGLQSTEEAEHSRNPASSKVASAA